MVDPSDVPRLSTLRDWSRDDWAAQSWACWQGDLSPKRVLSAVIYAADRELSWQGETNSNTIRGLWYNPVKPIVEEVFPHRYDGPGTEHFNREMTKALSKALSELVKDPDEPITYRGLNILDESRERTVRTYGPESDRVLFVESDGAYYSLKPLADVYRLTIVSGAGWQSTACIEDLAYTLDERNEYTLWFVSDYDPAGFGIVEDFADRLEQLGIDVDRDSSRRLGIRPEQVSEQTIRQQSFVVGDSAPGAQAWKEEYGIGPDGRFGLELDAVGDDLEGGSRALRQLLSDAIRDEIRETHRRHNDVQAEVNTVAQAVADEIVDPLRRELLDAATEFVDNADDRVVNALYHGGKDRLTTYFRHHQDAVEASNVADRLPTVYEPDDLHAGAVEGTDPELDSDASRDALQEWLLGRIDENEIETASPALRDRLDGSGGEDGG